MIASTSTIDQAGLAAVVARTLIRQAPAIVPALIVVLDRATDAMIAEGDLPDDVLEAIDDFGNFASRAAAEMFAARAARHASGSSSPSGRS